MDTSQTLSADVVPVLIKEKMLSIANKDTVFYDMGDKENLPEGQGKTIQFTRYERLPLPSVPATEGVTPTETPLNTSTVQAVVDQWIAVVSISDVAQLTVRHPVLRIAQQRLGTQHAETVDRECQRVLMGGSNVVFAGVGASRSALAPGDVVNTDLVRKIIATLRQNGAPSWDGGDYAGVVDPFVEQDLTKDPTFVNAASYSNIRTLFAGEIGRWMGVRWKRSNLIPIISLMPAGGNNLTFTTPAVAGSEVAFTGNVVGVATSLDAVTGFETVVSAVSSAAGAASAFGVVLGTTLPTGTYNIYVSLDGGTIPTFQVQVAHVVGAADTRTFFRSGPASGANRFAVQATGPVAPPAPPASGNVHISYVFGKESFGVTDLGGLKTTLTPLVASDSDPAMQRRKCTWKQMFKAVLKDTSRFLRVESLSAFN